MWEAVRAPTAAATGQCMRYVRIFFFRLTAAFILGSRACVICFSCRLSCCNLILAALYRAGVSRGSCTREVWGCRLRADFPVAGG